MIKLLYQKPVLQWTVFPFTMVVAALSSVWLGNLLSDEDETSWRILLAGLVIAGAVFIYWECPKLPDAALFVTVCLINTILFEMTARHFFNYARYFEPFPYDMLNVLATFGLLLLVVCSPKLFGNIANAQTQSAGPKQIVQWSVFFLVMTVAAISAACLGRSLTSRTENSQWVLVAGLVAAGAVFICLDYPKLPRVKLFFVVCLVSGLLNEILVTIFLHRPTHFGRAMIDLVGDFAFFALVFGIIFSPRIFWDRSSQI